MLVSSHFCRPCSFHCVPGENRDFSSVSINLIGLHVPLGIKFMHAVARTCYIVPYLLCSGPESLPEQLGLMEAPLRSVLRAGLSLVLGHLRRGCGGSFRESIYP